MCNFLLTCKTIKKKKFSKTRRPRKRKASRAKRVSTAESSCKRRLRIQTNREATASVQLLCVQHHYSCTSRLGILLQFSPQQGGAAEDFAANKYQLFFSILNSRTIFAFPCIIIKPRQALMFVHSGESTGLSLTPGCMEVIKWQQRHDRPIKLFVHNFIYIPGLLKSTICQQVPASLCIKDIC